MAPGSSPLARGTLRLRTPPAPAARFIPARAGNTSSIAIPSRRATVHPRSRGEHDEDGIYHDQSTGSSPLARGTRRRQRRRRVRGRFIPARAGNTVLALLSYSRFTVHPRSRGEHRGRSVLLYRCCGSSPLARGTRRRQVPRRLLRRFIPARAGNTGPSSSRTEPRTVHPRSRGEHGKHSAIAWRAYGSSPLARGTHPEDAIGLSPQRFIPARAGNTPAEWMPPKAPAVHPRSRGEHSPIGCASRPSDGSSPLARGTPPATVRARPRPRFIPARAGNTSGAAREPSISTVHPRSRGEHF